MDIIESELGTQSGVVNATRRDNHIPAAFVRLARDAHVRYAHMSPSELAKVIVSGARADMPKYTACCSIHESYGAMALYLL